MSDSKKFQKNDFLEIEFTGKIKDTGEIFDTNRTEDLKKINSESPSKPFIFCLGQKMFLPAVEDFLIGKEEGKYTISLAPEKAFGTRNLKFIQLMPMNIFKKHDIYPVQGMTFNFDNQVGKIISVSGGRVRVDFNHPVAGKEVVYEINVLRQVSDIEEKVKSFIEFLFRRELKFSVDNIAKKIIINLNAEESQMKQLIELFSEKFKDIFGMGLEVTAVEKVKEVKAEDKKTKEKSVEKIEKESQ